MNAKKDVLKKVSQILLALMSCISIVISIFCLTNCSNEQYKMIFSLPLIYCFCLCALFYFKINVFRGIGTLLIIFTFFFRLVIEPLIMTLGNYSSDFSVSIFSKNINLAITLMIYEIIVVISMYIILCKDDSNISFIQLNTNVKSEKLNLKKLFNKNFILIISVLILFCLLSVAMFNDLSHYFSLFFKGNEAAFKQVVLIKKMVENTPSIIYYPFKLVIEILRIALAPILLIFIYNTNFKEKIKIFLSFIFLLILLCISSQEQINSILIVFACALLIVRLYPNYSKVFMIIGSILIILFVTFGLVTFSGIDDFDRMSQVLQAYFSGPSNVALGITIGRSKALDFFLGDFFRNIPIFATFFKNMIVTNDYMNIVGSLSGGASITPFISDGYIYFGKILSILPTMIITYIIIKLEKNLYNNNYDVYTYFIKSISIIIIALCPVLYSVGIFYSYIMSIIIPINILDYIRTNVLKISFDKEGLHNAYKKISN